MATYLSLEEAAKKLGISTEKLVDMRSQGEVRGFRDGTSWKFPDSEIERLQSELADSPPSSGQDMLGDSSLALGVLGDSDLGIGEEIVSGSTGSGSAGGDSDVNLIPASGDGGSDVAIVTSDPDLLSGDSDGLLEIDSSNLKIGEKAITHDSAQLDLAVEPNAGSTGPVTDEELKEIADSHSGSGMVENSGLSALSGLDFNPDDDEVSLDEDLGVGNLDSNLSLDDDLSLDDGKSVSSSALGADNSSELDLGIDSDSGNPSSSASDLSFAGPIDEPDSADVVIGAESGLDLEVLGSSSGVLDSEASELSESAASGVSNLELMGDLSLDSSDSPGSEDLLRSSRGADVLSELDLLSAEQGGSGLISSDSGDLLASSGLLSGSGLGSSLEVIGGGSDSGIDDALADDDELVIADDDDDLVISSAGSDISVAGDSGINLMSPSDSGLSLESEPLDLAGSSISALDLGAELADGSGSGPISGGGSDAGSMVDFEADEEFQLSASGVGIEADADGSQVIEIEDSQAIGEPVEFAEAGVMEADVMDADVFGDAPAAVADDPFGDAGGGFGEEAVAMEVEGGEVVIDESGSPVMAGPMPNLGYEVPFTLLQCIGLLLTICMMCVGGMLMTDLARNMLTYTEVSAPVSSLTDLLMSWL